MRTAWPWVPIDPYRLHRESAIYLVGHVDKKRDPVRLSNNRTNFSRRRRGSGDTAVDPIAGGIGIGTRALGVLRAVRASLFAAR